MSAFKLHTGAYSFRLVNFKARVWPTVAFACYIDTCLVKCILLCYQTGSVQSLGPQRIDFGMDRKYSVEEIPVVFVFFNSVLKIF